MDWNWREAPAFYGLLAFFIGFAALFVMIPGLPLIQVMFLAQVLNALLLPFILVFVMLLAGDRELLGAAGQRPRAPRRSAGCRRGCSSCCRSSWWSRASPGSDRGARRGQSPPARMRGEARSAGRARADDRRRAAPPLRYARSGSFAASASARSYASTASAHRPSRRSRSARAAW